MNKCPEENYSPLGQAKLGTNQQEIKQTMKPYCRPVSDTEFDQDVETLVRKEICPPWYLKSTEILGRCFPVSIQAAKNKTSDEVLIYYEWTELDNKYLGHCQKN